ncbi:MULTISPECIES: hypothetical protein [unclassified Mycobacterium]|uniref:hypothetical protein n=1 Tax=unclassified Mycobacterium TaxID=2642494 RepID=UPI0009EF3735|nr:MULTISPECIES: hypothetical protein [unclassified Mycobacterium]
MESNYKEYNFYSSLRRIDEILATPRGNYEEVDQLPDRSRLTFTNGFYANCSAVFVDLRDSSSLPTYYQRPALAKLYRAYISEVVAVLNSVTKTKEINIVGDGVWAVINTPWKSDIDDVFTGMCRINSLMKVLNCKLRKAGYDKVEIKAGIGAEWGRALMIKAGYEGSGINDVVYMGDVVNYAAKLAAKGNQRYAPPMYIGNGFAGNLNEENQLFLKQDWTNGCYTADTVMTHMQNWYDENCT